MKSQARIKAFEADAQRARRPGMKTGTNTFLPLTTALMGDPFSLLQI
jgi:hypothetical protein